MMPPKPNAGAVGKKPRKKGLKPQSAKGKGRRFQQKTMRLLCDLFKDELVLNEDIRSTPMGSPGDDLLMSPRAFELIPFNFECKNVENLSIWAALRQAWARLHPTRHPIVAAAKNHTEPVAVVPLGWVVNTRVGKHVIDDRVQTTPGCSLTALLKTVGDVWGEAIVVVHTDRAMPFWPTLDKHKGFTYLLFDSPHAVMAVMPFEVFGMLLKKRFDGGAAAEALEDEAVEEDDRVLLTCE
jgi:hypothetical protein